jgi:hypothetical protein
MTIRRLSIVALAAAVLLAACATKPPAAPEPEPQPQIVTPVPEPVKAPEPVKEPEISRAELDALHARVLALRKDAFELGLKDLMSKEYAEAETHYISGKTALDADTRPLAKTELSAAEPLFAELVAKGGTMVAKTKQSDAAAARKRALGVDAETLSPAALALADAALAAADAALAAGDFKAAIASYGLAVSAFDAVEKRSSALAVKATVDSLDYGPLDAGNYALAGQKMAAVDELLAKEPKAAQDAAEESLLRYRLVLAKGWELTAGGKRDAAQKFKLDAEKIKAQVAVKAEYAEAKTLWDEGLAVFAAGNHEVSAPIFEQAELMFSAVYDKAAAKRAAAEAAIKAAASKNEESATIVVEADEKLGTTEDSVAPATEGKKE